jgi:hypothetical protein
MKNVFKHEEGMKIGNSMNLKMSSHVGTITKVLYRKDTGTFCEVKLNNGKVIKTYIDYSTPIYS